MIPATVTATIQVRLLVETGNPLEAAKATRGCLENCLMSGVPGTDLLEVELINIELPEEIRAAIAA